MKADLRSDTVTRPTEAMRRAMAQADVGDDVFREDPTVRALEERVASLLGKEAALFVPSGTMANQLALLLHTRRGEEVIVGEGAHCAYYESGAGGALAGVQFVYAGKGGLFTAEEARALVRPDADWYPRTRLIALENTHNRGGGRVFAQDEVLAIAGMARSLGLALHLDGARLWNASIASGQTEEALAAPFDTVSVCLSKGLGAPVGSLLAGTKDTVREGRRLRKMLGGGMRQAGILAAAGLYSLEQHRARLADDHAHAQLLFERLTPERGARKPETNIVMLELPVLAEPFAEKARAQGVFASVFGPTRLRLVTHLDVDREAVLYAAQVLCALLDEVRP